MHRSQDIINGDGGEAGGVIGHRIRDDEFAPVQMSVAGINDVRYVAFSFVLVGLKQRLAQPMRCESSGSKGRKRTRDWSGLSSVLVRVTLIALVFMADLTVQRCWEKCSYLVSLRG